MADDPTPSEQPAPTDTTREPARSVPVRTALKVGADEPSWWQKLNRYQNTDDAP